MSDLIQGELPLDSQPGEPVSTGLNAWREMREMQWREMARKTGLPLYQRVRVTLLDGLVLEGTLEPADPGLMFHTGPVALFELRIDAVQFFPPEIESCIRLN